MAGLWDSVGSITGGLFGNDPYKKAEKQYKKYTNKAAEYQNPFFNAGKGAIPDYQNYLNDMKDPSEFINKLMGNYEESPHSKYLQDQNIRSATNAASASGLSGSTPMTQFIQENSNDIASGDINQWLQNVLGINNKYGSGLENLLGMGENSANQLSGLYGNLGNKMGDSAAGSGNYKNKQISDILSGIFGLGSNLSPFNSGSGSGGNSANMQSMMMKLLPFLMG